MGRSRSGLHTKVPALTDALGNPLDFELTGGQGADIPQGEALLPEEPVGAGVADKGQETDAFVATVSARGGDPASQAPHSTAGVRPACR